MPNWIAITTDTLYEAKVAALIDACDTAALAENQEPRSPGIIQGVVDEVRNAVGTCTKNQVDSDLTKIPKNLRDLAVDMIIARLKATLEIEQTEDERSNLSWRRNQLKAVAACELAVDKPDAPIQSDVQGGPSVQLVRPGRMPGDSTHPFAGI